MAEAGDLHIATLLAVQVLFGLFPVAAKRVFEEMDPLPVLAVRLAGAALALLLVHRLLVRDPVPITREWPRILGLAILGIVLNMSLFLVGLQYTTPVNAVVMITSIPVFTYALAVLLGRETLGPRRALGIAVALGGVLTLVGSSYRADPLHALGDLLILANALAYSAFLVLARPIMQRHDPLSVTTWMFAIGAVVFLPVGWLLGMPSQLAAASPATLGWLLYIILGATVATYVLSARVLRHVPASTVAVFTYAQPVITAVAAYLVLATPLDWKVLPAAAFIFAGVWLVARRRPKVLEGQVVTE